MKKLLLMAAASVALSGFAAAPAGATSLTDWTFIKEKNTLIIDNTYVDKTVDIWVNDVQPLDSAGKSLVAINSDIVGDFVTYAIVVPPPGVFPGEQGSQTDFGNPFGYLISRHATITGSVLNDVGIGQINQDVGNNSNQGNVIAAGLVFGGNDLVSAEAYEQDINILNRAYHVEPKPLTEDPNALTVGNQTADLTGSFNNLTGVFMGNQNAGNMNSQHNALSAAVGDAAFTALADAGLDQVNGGNVTYDANTVKRDNITGSINANTGIVTFNQSVGSMNNQSTIINLAVLSSSVGL